MIPNVLPALEYSIIRLKAIQYIKMYVAYV